MSELKITISAPEIAAALDTLAAVLACFHTPSKAVTIDQTAIPTAPAVPTVVPTAAPAAQQTAPVPTAAPQYTLDMIATAGSALIDAGKLDQLMQLLAKFGVDSLTNLAPASYGAVATELRALGARI